MPIVSVKEQWSGRNGRISNNWQRAYTRVFQVITDDNLEGQISVAFALGIPRVGDFYASALYGEWDAYALCHEVRPEQDDGDPRLWKVTCDFQTQTGQAPPTATGGITIPDATRPGSGGGSDNPTNRPPDIEFDVETFRIPFVKGFDKEGGVGSERVIPVANSVGQKFDPAQEIEVAATVYRVSRYESLESFSINFTRKYAFALNIDEFKGAAPGQSQCLPIRARLEYVGQTPYWRTSYAVRFVPEGWDTWDVEILDAGRYKIGPGPGFEPVPIFDETTRQPVTEDWPLNGAGAPLSRADVLDGNVQYLKFYAYRKQSFAALGLP